MSGALMITYSIGLQYVVDKTWTHNIYIKRQISKLEGIVSAVLACQSLSLKVVGSGRIHSLQ